MASSDSELLEDTDDINDFYGRVGTSVSPNVRVESGRQSFSEAFHASCRGISSSFLGTGLRLQPDNYLYDDSVQIFFSAPPTDDIPLLNDDGSVDGASSVNSVEDHCHLPKPDHAGSKRAITKLYIAIFLALVFMITEVVGGYLANSIAIMSDAAHMFSDLISFVVSLVAIYLSMRPASRTMNYGYYRAEVLGALMSVLIIWVLTGALVYAAVDRIVTNDYDVEAGFMIIVSAVGVVMNIILGLVLHYSGGGHGHSHGIGGGGHSHGNSGGGHSHGNSGGGHSHGNHGATLPTTNSGAGPSGENGDNQSAENPKPNTNINIRAAFIHVLGDLLQSVGVLVAAIIIRFYPEYKIADPICTFFFSVLVLVTTIPIIRDVCRVLMEGAPSGVDHSALSRDLAALPSVKMVHSLHIWTITQDKNACSVHLAIDEGSDCQVVLKAAQRLIRTRHQIFQTTIQVEIYDPQLMDNCYTCKLL